MSRAPIYPLESGFVQTTYPALYAIFSQETGIDPEMKVKPVQRSLRELYIESKIAERKKLNLSTDKEEKMLASLS